MWLIVLVSGAQHPPATIQAKCSARNIFYPEPVGRSLIGYCAQLTEIPSGEGDAFVTITVRHNQASTMSEFTQMAERALADDGFLELDAPKIGESILELERRRFPLASEHGLDFIRQHLLDDEVSTFTRLRGSITNNLQRITSIIDSVFPDGCVIGHFLRYQAYPGRAVSLWRRRGSEDGRHAVVVHFLPIGSQVNYIQGSHLLELSLQNGSRSLWEAPAAELLAETGCKKVQKHFKDGGL